MATYFEFTEDGLTFSGFQDIRSALQEDWNNTFGVELDYSATSPDGHHIDLEARTINSVAEMIQGVCANLNRSTATGQYLEFLAEYLGLHRNTVDGEPESDASLRVRMNKATTRGLATFDGMLTYLQDAISPLIGLSENTDGDTDDNGVQGHSVRVVVPESLITDEDDPEEGKFTPNEIANAIWACKPAGIGTSGNSIGTATDTVGNPHTVNFSKPESVDVDVKVTITTYGEESLPSDYDTQIASSIVSWASTNLVPGKDVLPQRLLIPIFNVSGIESAAIMLKKHDDSTYSADAIRISSEQTAVITASNITVAMS